MYEILDLKIDSLEEKLQTQKKLILICPSNSRLQATLKWPVFTM